MEVLKYFTNNQFLASGSNNFYKVYDPSLGEHIANMPKLTVKEVRQVIDNAHKGYLEWSKTPIMKRVQVLYKVRELLVEKMEELTYICAREHGKNWNEAEGDVLKAKEGLELAISMPSLITGESLMDASVGYDTVSYREPLGVFAGIAPFNFPAMIPMGWMAPVCIACGNSIVIKVSGATPMTSLKIAELYRQVGLPDGVLNIVCCDRNDTQELLSNDKIKGVTFVGSTKVGRIVYEKAAKHGKRVQCLCEAKNHALVLNDAALDRTAAGIINSAFGCAGQRCMALPVVVAEEQIADALVAKIKELASKIKIGKAYDRDTQLGPVYSKEHKQKVLEWISKGLDEGAEMVLDGRDVVVKGSENGFYIGPTILDKVTPEMTVGQKEIFGPVLCIKRVKNFDEGLKVMNSSPYANGSVIFTQSGYFAREFARNTHGGMVGINVGIPVPIGVFSFTGHKQSFFGDLHCLGKDSYRFFTEQKTVTTRWFDEEEKKMTTVSTWDGTI
ncbi:MAG: CoA-acylating methylmalonate-semialdehyde dehydrogenase [Clostridiales bacterium]|nr:CoA-acylating methylmalonate-semialdehyde dehydrogenase [Clostridiales bacterium]